MGIPDIRLLISVDFEVFGNVQGCSFTKYTRDLCVKAGIKGWVKNSKQGTIVGKMQGPKEEVDKIRTPKAYLIITFISDLWINWMSTTGSPGCHIDHCDISNSVTLNRLDYKDFAIRF